MLYANVAPSTGFDLLQYGALGVLLAVILIVFKFLEKIWESKRLETPQLPGKNTNGGKTVFQAVQLNNMENALAQLQRDTSETKKDVNTLKSNFELETKIQTTLLQSILDELKQLNQKRRTE